MLRVLLSACAVLFVSVVTADACPTFAKSGTYLSFTGDQLYSPQSYSTMATGGAMLSNCGISGAGSVSASPQYTLNLSGMQGYDLEIQVNSSCDATLLVNSANGIWYFDDDSNGNLDPMLRISGSDALNGQVDVWVGTLGSNCSATIEFETWTATTAAPSNSGNCPTIGLTGPSYHLNGPQLYSPTNFAASAYGSGEISGCGLPGHGWFTPAPQFSFNLSQMQGYRLELQVNASCDTVMLVNTADGTWLFDDDSNGNLDPLINVYGPSALNGRVDVWLGTYNGQSCPANLELETWTN